MADEIVYRLIAGEGVQIVEDSGTKTATLSVPGLSNKLNVGDIGQANQVAPGIIEIATDAEVQALSDPDRAVTPAGLGAASQANAIDGAEGRLLRVGAFGLGTGAYGLTAPNLNDERPTGFYYCTSPVNGPSGITAGWLFHEDYSVSGYAVQTFSSVAGRRWMRANNAGTWGTWVELYHTGNFDPASKANTSGNYPSITSGNSAQVGGQTAGMLAPPGAIMDFAMSTAPSGWLHANGAAVSRTTYAALFAAIGTQWGAGNGSSTFNLPDLRGEFRRGWDAGRGLDSGRGFGTVQGSQNLTHGHGGSVSSGGSHSHTGTTDAGGEHQHRQGSESLYADYGAEVFVGSRTYLNGELPSYRNQYTEWAGNHQHSFTTDGVGDHAHTLSISDSGGGEARPRNVSVLTCIKT